MSFLDFPCVWFKNEQIVEEFLPLSPFFQVFPLNLPVKNWDISRKSVGGRFFSAPPEPSAAVPTLVGNMGKCREDLASKLKISRNKKHIGKTIVEKKRVERSSPCFHFAFLTPRARPEASEVNIDAVRAKVVYWNPMWPYICRGISFRVIQTQWWFPKMGINPNHSSH